jgi:ABC-2 type transport system permease protein
VGLFMSTIAIFFTDVTEMYGILLSAWFYLSPIIWNIDMLPPQYAWIVKLNPMYHLINLFRAPVYYGTIPPASDFLICGSIALVTLLVGWFVFSLKSDEFAYRV